MDLGNLGDKAKDLLEEHADKVDDGIDKVADLVDEKTGGKFADAVDKVQDAAKGAADKIAGDNK